MFKRAWNQAKKMVGKGMEMANNKEVLTMEKELLNESRELTIERELDELERTTLNDLEGLAEKGKRLPPIKETIFPAGKPYWERERPVVVQQANIRLAHYEKAGFLQVHFLKVGDNGKMERHRWLNFNKRRLQENIKVLNFMKNIFRQWELEAHEANLKGGR